MDKYTTADLERLLSEITPGPWKSNSGDYVASEAELPSTRVIGWGCVDGFVCDLNDGEYHEYTDRAEQEANARAIALVPDLLAEVIALRAALEKIADGDGVYGAQAYEYKIIARSALQRKEGDE